MADPRRGRRRRRRRQIEPVESGGPGADTDPGVTGGYGDTSFGAVDTEPIPVNTEPDEQ